MEYLHINRGRGYTYWYIVAPSSRTEYSVRSTYKNPVALTEIHRVLRNWVPRRKGESTDLLSLVLFSGAQAHGGPTILRTLHCRVSQVGHGG